MRTMTLWAWGVAGIALLSSTAEAQTVDRARWSTAVSLGGGSAGLHDPSISVSREIGAAIGIRAAYGFRPDMLIGAGIGGWFGQVGSETWDITIFGPELTWYPGARNFFARFMLGFGLQTASVGETTVPGKDDSGPGAMAALGYELPIVRTVTLTFHGEYGYLNAGTDTWSDMVNFQVGFAWYPSTPKQP